LTGNVENLTLLGTADIAAEGNKRDNIITGNAGDNDLIGAIGADILIGGKGRDDFIYTALADSGKGLARDVIKDFAEDIDQIDLSLMDAVTSTVPDDPFVWIGGAAFSGVAGQLRVTKIDLAGSASDKTIVAGDVDGNKVADFQIELSGLHKLDAGDFVL
jgi:serralysin